MFFTTCISDKKILNKCFFFSFKNYDDYVYNTMTELCYRNIYVLHFGLTPDNINMGIFLDAF